MLVSKALYTVTIIFAIFSIYCTFHGFYLITVKFKQTSQTNLLDSNSPQWFEPKTTKVIMLVVDSLRFDYLAQDPTIQPNEKLQQNKLTKFSNLFTTSPENTVLLRTKSEAPTLAIERIPSLMTGNIPPKANIIRAFGALSISEDNILKQLSNANKKVYFSGPPLWTQMFPDEFAQANTLSSSDLENLRNPNVDQSTMDFIRAKMQQNTYDMIIGHLLSIDHMGHSYGLADSRVAEALAKLDQFIIDLIEKMNDETILIVLGDHGMTDQGEHGHGSLAEIDTLIAAYSKKSFQKYQGEKDFFKSIMKSFTTQSLAQIKQVDIVPTLSMLMGVPIPFSNMGNIINDLYPSVMIPPQQMTCPGTGIQISPLYVKNMLQDNHLNSLQIIQYFEKYQAKTHLFNSKEVNEIKTLQQKVHSTHGSAINMLNNQLQCQDAFNPTLTEAILTSQKLSDQVYQMILNKGSYDLSLIYQGTALLLLVLASYVLIIQFLYRHGLGEDSILFNMTNTSIAFKRALPVLVILLIVSLVTWFFKRRIIHPITSSFLCIAIWLFFVFCGFLFQKRERDYQDDSPLPAEIRIQLHQAHIASQEKEFQSAIRKQKSKKKLDINNHTVDENEPEKLAEIPSNPKLPFDKVPLFNRENQNGQILQSSTLFLFKKPVYSVIAALAIAVCMMISHKSHYESLDYTSPESSALAITLILFTTRLTTLLAHNVYLQLSGVVFFIAVLLIMVFTIPLAKIRVVLGLILIIDWLWNEVRYLVDKLLASKIVGYSHLACFFTISAYQLIDNRETNYGAEIVLPRVISAIILGNIFYSWKFRGGNAKSFKRNLQLCLVQFLLLVQASKSVFVFGLLMTAMRLTTHLFKRANPLNFLYPLMIAIESHLGIFLLGHSDRWIPAGFTDFNGFSFVLSPVVIFLNVMTSYVLGLLTISQRSNAYSQIINKRNVIIFVLLFNIVYFGAVVKAYVNLGFYFNESIEKFILDATIYIFTIISGYFIF